MCDFAGFVEPEIVKKRPVVVIARNRANKHLVTVVPLSTTEPEVMENHHFRLPRNPVPAHKGKTCWAKCDLVATVSLERLDRLKDGWNRVVPGVSDADLRAIRLCVVNALQLQNTVLQMRSAANTTSESVVVANSVATTLILGEAVASNDAAKVVGGNA